VASDFGVAEEASAFSSFEGGNVSSDAVTAFVLVVDLPILLFLDVLIPGLFGKAVVEFVVGFFLFTTLWQDSLPQHLMISLRFAPLALLLFPR